MYLELNNASRERNLEIFEFKLEKSCHKGCNGVLLSMSTFYTVLKLKFIQIKEMSLKLDGVGTVDITDPPTPSSTLHLKRDT